MGDFLERLADMVERRTGGIRPTHEELAASNLMRSIVSGCGCSTCDRCGQPVQDQDSVESPDYNSSAGIKTASRRAALREEERLSGPGNARKHSINNATIGQLVQPVSLVPAPKPPIRTCNAEPATLPGLPHSLGTSIPSPCKGARIYYHAPKTKVKTRPNGIAAKSTAQNTVDENQESDTVPPSPQKVYMSSASREILARIIATDPSNTSPLHFDDFVAAMVDAGFTVKHSGRSAGSAVRFKDTRTKKGTITFHCPHPDPRVDHNKLRTWGSRLNKKFGWELETLVEREK